MKRMGEMDVDEKKVKEMPVRFAFPIDDKTVVFPAREQVIGVLASFLSVSTWLRSHRVSRSPCGNR